MRRVSVVRAPKLRLFARSGGGEPPRRRRRPAGAATRAPPPGTSVFHSLASFDPHLHARTTTPRALTAAPRPAAPRSPRASRAGGRRPRRAGSPRRCAPPCAAGACGARASRARAPRPRSAAPRRRRRPAGGRGRQGGAVSKFAGGERERLRDRARARTWKTSPEPSSPETCSTAAGRRWRRVSGGGERGGAAAAALRHGRTLVLEALEGRRLGHGSVWAMVRVWECAQARVRGRVAAPSDQC